MITQERLKEVLHYNPDTGDLTWLKRIAVCVTVGTVLTGITDRGYGRVKIDGKTHKLHRLAWLYMHGSLPLEIDHINGKRADNRAANLRSVSRSENQKNMSLSRHNKSGVSGVTWDKREQRFKARIGRKLFLGTFDNLFDAVCIRKSAELKHGYHENHGRTI